jgi:hypothetical protein
MGNSTKIRDDAQRLAANQGWYTGEWKQVRNSSKLGGMTYRERATYQGGGVQETAAYRGTAAY